MRALRIFSVALLVVGLAVSSSSAYTLLGTKWDPDPNTASWVFGPPKSPGGATWSIMGAGLGAVSGLGAGHVGSTSGIADLGVSGWGLTHYEAAIDTALNTWADVSGFTNLGNSGDGLAAAGALEIDDGHLGDIRVAAWEIAEPGELAHAYAPGTEAIIVEGGTILGDAHFDVYRDWVDDPTDTNADLDFDLPTVLLHEFGHSLGLGHSNRRGAVMYPSYSGARRSLSGDDRKGIQALYGKGGDDGDDGGHGGGKPPWAGGGGRGNSIGIGSHNVPEPSTLVLAVMGLLGVSIYGCRRKGKR